MATMQAARKRDAETAFAGSNGKYQDHDEQSEEQEASQQESTQTSTGNQQMLVDNILQASKKATRKLANNLLDNTQKVFSGFEQSVASLYEARDSEMDEHIGQLAKYIAEAKKINQDPFSLSLSELEQQLHVFDQLTSCYVINGSEVAAKLNADMHIKRRVHHKCKISQQGAQVARKQMKQASRDAQIRIDTKTFAQAHREFFKTIQGSRPAA